MFCEIKFNEIKFQTLWWLGSTTKINDDDEGVCLSVFFHSSDYQQEMMERINDLFRQMCADRSVVAYDVTNV